MGGWVQLRGDGASAQQEWNSKAGWAVLAVSEAQMWLWRLQESLLAAAAAELFARAVLSVCEAQLWVWWRVGYLLVAVAVVAVKEVPV